jgi:hypothetical protein
MKKMCKIQEKVKGLGFFGGNTDDVLYFHADVTWKNIYDKLTEC